VLNRLVEKSVKGLNYNFEIATKLFLGVNLNQKCLDARGLAKTLWFTLFCHSSVWNDLSTFASFFFLTSSKTTPAENRTLSCYTNIQIGHSPVGVGMWCEQVVFDCLWLFISILQNRSLGYWDSNSRSKVSRLEAHAFTASTCSA